MYDCCEVAQGPTPVVPTIAGVTAPVRGRLAGAFPGRSFYRQRQDNPDGLLLSIAAEPDGFGHWPDFSRKRSGPRADLRPSLIRGQSWESSALKRPGPWGRWLEGKAAGAPPVMHTSPSGQQRIALNMHTLTNASTAAPPVCSWG